VFAYNLGKSQWSILPAAVGVCKMILDRDDGFTEENIMCTESVMGAMAKMAYKHMDGKNLTTADLAGVLSRMPFTAQETENMTSHRILIEQCLDPKSIVHNNAVKPAAQAAIKRIREYNGEAKIMSH